MLKVQVLQAEKTPWETELAKLIEEFTKDKTVTSIQIPTLATAFVVYIDE